MTARSMTGGLSPSELSDAALAKSLTGFLALYGDTHLLLVRIESGNDELERGLGATALRGGEGIRLKPVTGGSMEFHTVTQSTPAVSPAMRPRSLRDEPASIVSLLRNARYVALPLRKRGDSDALFMERISVGRARNKDIVLRHPSVSKFHAWFEVDEAGDVQVSDSGSRNFTRVNGDKLPPREQQRVASGDVIRFGSVECVLSCPQTLWAAVRLVGGAPR